MAAYRSSLVSKRLKFIVMALEQVEICSSSEWKMAILAFGCNPFEPVTARKNFSSSSGLLLVIHSWNHCFFSD